MKPVMITQTMKKPDLDLPGIFEGQLTLTFTAPSKRIAQAQWRRLVTLLDQSGTAYANKLKVVRRAMVRVI